MDKSKRFISPPQEDLQNLRQPMTEGERKFFEFLNNQLPSDWDIYIQPHLNGLRPDFVIMSPKKGIAIFEVKDWNFSLLAYSYIKNSSGVSELIGVDGTKSFSLKKDDPFKKIKIYREEIYNLYCPSLAKKRGFRIIYSGIVFSKANKTQIDKLIDSNPDITDGYTNLLYEESLTNSHIKNVLPFIYRIESEMNLKIYNDLKHWLVEPEYSAEQRIPLIKELNKKQLDLALSRNESGKRRIRGPAGSGKSMVLSSRAATLAIEDKEVLIVTYNITLINYLLDLAVRFKNKGYIRNKITALNFHYLCKRYADLSGNLEEYKNLWINGEDENLTINTNLPNAAAKWFDTLEEEEKFDGLFIDEGQDFNSESLDAIRKLVKKDGEIMLCIDQAQNIYGNASLNETIGPLKGFGSKWVDLDTSYRLPPELCKLSTDFINTFLPSPENQRPIPEEIQGELLFPSNLKWIQTNDKKITDVTLEVLLEMIDKSNPSLAFANATCIVQRINKGRELVSLLHKKNIKCIDTFADEYNEIRRKKMAFFKGSAKVKITTLHSFKGWEASSLVIQITSAKTKDHLSQVYVGMTRLKKLGAGSYLTVICSDNLLNDFGKKWPSYKEMF